MKYKRSALIIVSISFMIMITLTHCKDDSGETDTMNRALVNEGKNIFRFDTFGDEEFWSGLLHIDKAIAGADNGGFGPGVSPKTALSVGLKVDSEALPPQIVEGIKAGTVDLDDPATTLELIKLDAVVGVKGILDDKKNILSIGITCASCHSTVDDSFAPGIGIRLDGWPNRDLNVGAIFALTDNAQPIADMLHVDETTLRAVLNGWGPGKFPAILFMDGKATRPDGQIAANLIPAAFGLKGIELTTYTGWGDITYWNSFVANLEMYGKGNFSDPRLNDMEKYPIAVENNFYNVRNDPDLITSKLPALRAYQHSLPSPKPPMNSFDAQLAALGREIFLNKAECVSCHASPLLADNELHTAEEIGIDDFEAKRSPTGKYRTTPLGGLFTRTKGGFYHDGRFATLTDVIEHYDTHLSLKLTASEKDNLEEYLKSL